jgi:hypothetical protein
MPVWHCKCPGIPPRLKHATGPMEAERVPAQISTRPCKVELEIWRFHALGALESSYARLPNRDAMSCSARQTGPSGYPIDFSDEQSPPQRHAGRSPVGFWIKCRALRTLRAWQAMSSVASGCDATLSSSVSASPARPAMISARSASSGSSTRPAVRTRKLTLCMPACLPACLHVNVPVRPTHPSACLSVCLPFCPSHPPKCMPVCKPASLPSCLRVFSPLDT